MQACTDRIAGIAVQPFTWTLLLCIFSFPTLQLIAQEEPSKEDVRAFAARHLIRSLSEKTAAVALAAEKGWPVRQVLPNGGVMEIMSLGPDGMPVYHITDNLDAAITSGTNHLWPDSASGLNLDGAGFLIGEWDGGRVKRLHQEFDNGSGSRVTIGDGVQDLSDHSTHVAGTMIAEGQEPYAHGMASEALLHAYDWDNDVAEMATEYDANDLKLSNHSYGQIRGWYYFDAEQDWYWLGNVEISTTEDYLFGFYSDAAATFDSLAYYCPYLLIMKAAGNDRGEYHSGDHFVWWNNQWFPSNATRDPDGGSDGFDCISDRAVSKNVLTVGSVLDIFGGYSTASDVVMTSYSCWGPVDDGRIKPDLVASGTSLYSCISTSNTAYGPSSGTSMATPVVTGTCALLQDYYHSLHNAYMRSSTLKALLINTSYECGSNAGPDYKFGWGLLNSVGAADLIAEDNIAGDLIRQSYLFNNETETYTYYSTGADPVNVTICWTDPPGSPPAPSLNPATSMLVHDLDVRIIRTGGSTYYPWRLNPSSPASAASQNDNNLDNVEKVTISNPPPGEYTIQVNHKGTISGQYYAMVISGLSPDRPVNAWTGASGTAWTTPSNWSLGHEPIGSEVVSIPASCPNYPAITGSLGIGYNSGYNEVCHSLALSQGTSISVSGYDVTAAGVMSIDGTLYVGDDLILNNGAELTLTANGQLYTGYSDGFHGYLAMNAGSSVTQSGGNIYAEELQLYSGSQYSASAGYFHLYKQGMANASQNILIDDPDNHFYYFFIDTLCQAYLNNCTSDLNVDYITRVSGKLAVNAYTIHTYIMNVYGELNITQGTVDVTQTGPIFNNTSTLNMYAGNLNTYNSIWFNAGSGCEITSGNIDIRRDLNNQYGEFAPSGGRVRFYGDILSQLRGATVFSTVEIDKDTGFTAVSYYPVHVTDSLIISNGQLLIQNSTLHVGSGD